MDILNEVHFEVDEDINLWQPPTEAMNEPNEPVQIENRQQTLEDFDQWRVTKERYIPQPPPTITIGGAAFASPCNISAISAPSKAGKTALNTVFIAGAISEDAIIDGFVAIDVLPNPERKAVVSLDTEMSEADQQYLVNVALKRNRLTETPDFYRAYNIRQLSINTYKEFTDNVCELSSERFNGIHSIYIDGGADYITSVNDEEQANEIIGYFTHLSIKYNCPVIILLHLNPGSDKERGHFGSQLQRKCYGLLSITKENDISTVTPKIMRKANNGDIPLIHFKYSAEVGYHVEVDAPDKATKKVNDDVSRITNIAKKVFAPPTALSFTDAINALMKQTTKGKTTVKTMLDNMVGWGIVEHSEDKNYRLVLPKPLENSADLAESI